MTKEKRTKCPVCKVIYWDRAIKIHIINAAKGETYRGILKILDYGSREINIRLMPHLHFYRKHLRNKKVFTI